MTGSYPDEPAGEFPAPPTTFTDREDREITIETSDAADMEPLVEMYIDFDPEDRAQGIPPVREDQIRTWLDQLLAEDALNVVAWDDDDPVGHATLVPHTGESFELAIFVPHSHQGAGIGSHLLKRLLGYAQAEGIEKVWLTVERWNEPALGLYRDVGFETYKTDSFELEMAIRL